jgi:hypothetical protein
MPKNSKRVIPVIGAFQFGIKFYIGAPPIKGIPLNRILTGQHRNENQLVHIFIETLKGIFDFHKNGISFNRFPRKHY